jgi:spermidine/putrescine-binding protein
MQRLKFIDRMSQGKLSRRQMMQGAAAFGAAFVMLPRRASAAAALTALEWSGYDAPDYFGSYVAKHAGPPEFSIFASEEDALQKVRAGFAADAMHPCNYSVQRFKDAGLVRPIDTAKLTNWKDVFPALQTAQGVVGKDGEVMMAPADWGNSSIAYRPDLVDDAYKASESWGIFTDDKYKGRVAMSDNEVAVQISGLLYGYSAEKIFTMDGEDLAKVKDTVVKMVNNSRFLWNDPTEIQQGLASGEIVAAYAWNDTPVNVGKQGVPIAFAKPKEGYFTWFCGITLLNVGKGDVAAAHDFVDAWLSPETGKALIEGSGYGHSNIKAFEIASKDAVVAMGISDPVAHMKSAILFPTQDPTVLANQIKLWQETKALKQ